MVEGLALSADLDAAACGRGQVVPADALRAGLGAAAAVFGAVCIQCGCCVVSARGGLLPASEVRDAVLLEDAGDPLLQQGQRLLGDYLPGGSDKVYGAEERGRTVYDVDYLAV